MGADVTLDRAWRIGPAAGVLLALLVVAAPVMARDRPGTPDELRIWVDNRSGIDGLTEKPRLEVTFRNSAKEEVSFWAEWTVSGEPQTSELRELVSCPNAFISYICVRPYFKPPRDAKIQGQERTEAYDQRFGFRMPDVDFNTEYCFRFRAQDDDGVISENWSAWACAQSGPPPELPVKPVITQVSVLPGRTGQGEVGGAVPNRVLVEWAGESRRAAHYTIEELGEGSRWGTVADGIKVAGEPWEAAVKVGELPTMEHPTRYRLCAVNISGKTCSDGVSTKTYAAKSKVDSSVIEKPSDAADTKVDTGTVTAPPGDPVREAPAPGDTTYRQPAKPAADTKVDTGVVTEKPPDVIRSAPVQVDPPQSAPPPAEGRRRGPYGAP